MSNNNTTIWGVVIAAGLVCATVALNAPGGSSSIAGRAINAAMARMFPPRSSPQGVPASPSPQSVPTPPASAEAAPPARTAEAGDGEMTEAQVAKSAVRARANMSHAPAEIEFRNVQAVTVLGLFNAEAPDKPFLGFCGEVSVPEGRGWGRPGWKPFFISETASLPVRGQGPYLDMANPSTLSKCAYIKPGKDYSATFQAGETEVAPSYMLGGPRPS